MCEIAVVDPDEWSKEYTFGLLESMFERNNDGVGMVAVYRHASKFTYFSYSVERPTWREVLNFLSGHQGAWRVVLHARLATAGGTGDKESHPIPVNCSKCDASMVVHNGVVTGSRSQRRRLDDHDFLTGVDSEVIAHKHEELPRTLDDFEPPALYGTLNYLLFGEDRILVRATSKYSLSRDFEMATAKRECEPDAAGSRWLLITPDGVETKPIETSRSKITVTVSDDGNDDDSASRNGWEWDQWSGYVPSRLRAKEKRKSTGGPYSY